MESMERKPELLKYLVIDVDGTMTDAGIYYDEKGNEIKKFCTKDAAGFFAAREAGINIVVLTGRECQATLRRMREMKVEFLFQNIKQKDVFLKNFMIENNIEKEEIGYIGDDLNDYAAMSLVGYVACPKDSCLEIREISDYISPADGGQGVVRDVVERILRQREEWDDVVRKVYDSGI